MINFFSNFNVISFFLKAFAVVSSFIYFFYSIVVFQQTKTMNKILQSSGATVLSLISFCQILLALTLIILALFLI